MYHTRHTVHQALSAFSKHNVEYFHLFCGHAWTKGIDLNPGVELNSRVELNPVDHVEISALSLI